MTYYRAHIAKQLQFTSQCLEFHRSLRGPFSLAVVLCTVQCRTMSTTEFADISENSNTPRSDNVQSQTRFYEESLLISTWISSFTCFVAACIAVGLRLYSRKLKGQVLAWDDYVILLAMAAYVPFYITVVLGLVWGGGPLEPMTDLEYAKYEEVNSKVLVASSTISSTPLFFAKVRNTIWSISR